MSRNQELLIQLKKLQYLAQDQARKIKEQEQQLEIKSDAIKLQTEDIKRLDAELVWTKAALQQAEKSSQDAENRVTQLGGQGTDWQEKYTRLQAEMDNLRKRWENRSAEKVREERNRILVDMLPLADHLELALQHKQSQAANEKEGSSIADGAFIGNIRATLSAFMNTLQRYGVEPIGAMGQPFDPALHDAIGQLSSSEVPSDHVAQVLQTGYRDGDRLLRPAKVMVSIG